jgi:hypothetical protein
MLACQNYFAAHLVCCTRSDEGLITKVAYVFHPFFSGFKGLLSVLDTIILDQEAIFVSGCLT